AGPLPQPWILDQLDRFAFHKPSAAKLTIRGELDDREYETFAIAKPGQTQAGPLKVEWDSKPTKTKVTFSGDWEFPGEIAMINSRGNQEMFDVGSGWNTAFGHSRNATFMCKVSEIREVHFRMCGIQ